MLRGDRHVPICRKMQRSRRVGRTRSHFRKCTESGHSRGLRNSYNFRTSLWSAGLLDACLQIKEQPDQRMPPVQTHRPLVSKGPVDNRQATRRPGRPRSPHASKSAERSTQRHVILILPASLLKGNERRQRRPENPGDYVTGGNRSRCLSRVIG